MSMKMTLVRKPSGSPATDYEQFRGTVIQKILDGPIASAVEDFEDTQATWEDSGEMSFFNPETVAEPGQIVFRILMEGPSAEQATLSVWQLLEGGTIEGGRPMHVSEDWLSKTWPGEIIAGAGAGYTTGIYPPWANGIEPRNWIELIGDLTEPEAILEVGSAARAALDQIFNS